MAAARPAALCACVLVTVNAVWGGSGAMGAFAPPPALWRCGRYRASICSSPVCKFVRAPLQVGVSTHRSSDACTAAGRDATIKMESLPVDVSPLYDKMYVRMLSTLLTESFYGVQVFF